MDGLAAYKHWTPAHSPWSPWVKPVLFASMYVGIGNSSNLPPLPPIEWVLNVSRSTAVILDTPGEEAIMEALALSEVGYIPVPLFNGCHHPANALVRMNTVVEYLYAATSLLWRRGLDPLSPPVFILDSRRMQGGHDVSPGKFDNRWCVLPQDMPSADFLRRQGIERVLLRTERPAQDLSHVLKRYEQGGLALQICRDGISMEDMRANTPSLFRSLGYRFSALLGLRRNSAGGFGSLIPEPIDWGSGSGVGTGYYRAG